MQKKLWSKEFVAITSSTLFSAWAHFALLPTLPLYLLETLRFSPSNVGLIIASFPASVILVRLVAGYLADNYNRYVISTISLAAITVTYGIYPLASTFLGMFLVRFFHGAMFGISTTSNVTIAVDTVPPSQMGQGVGIYALTIPAGMTLGPVFGLEILKAHGPKGMFFAILAISVLSVLGILLAKTPSGNITKRRFSFPDLFHKKAIPISLCMFFIMFAYGAIIVFVSIYAKQKGFSNIGAFFVFFAITIIASRLFAGRSFDKGHVSQLIMIGLALAAVGILWLGYAADQTQFLIAGMINGFGFGILMPTCQAAVNSMVKSTERGAANSTYLLSYDMGIGAGSLVIGFLLDKISLEAIYRYSVSLIIIAAGIFVLKAIPHYYRNRSGTMTASDN
ncbi:MAG TPA: MFS transporter [Syntrophorhabdaceae bacterium]|nr:MFS transporter [Syntrophorhabdaceae bacterium]HQM81107.1 MFS transporter [Syntrophorhabdaceae bacterium]